MTIKYLKTTLATGIISIALLGITHNIAWGDQKKDHAAISSPLLHTNESTPLTEKNINEFVTTLAAIHQYYIHETNNNELFKYAIEGMVQHLDPHSMLLSADEMDALNTRIKGKFVGIGIELSRINGLLTIISPISGSPAQNAGIKSNDIIIKINNALTQKMSLADAVKKIKGKKGSTVTLTVLRPEEKKPLVFSIRRDTIHLTTLSQRLLEPGYGTIKIALFQGPLKQQLDDAIKQLKTAKGAPLKGVILDLRDNPGGLLHLSAEVVNTFLSPQAIKKYNGVIVSTRGRNKTANNTITATPENQLNGIPMVVLINHGSASASEIVAGALQDYHRALIVGTRSFGKGSVQSILPISADHAIKLTTSLYYTPKGQVIQSHGITPDIYIAPLTLTSEHTDPFKAQESDYTNHIKAHRKLEEKARNKIQEQESTTQQVRLAKSDYPLFQALMILKGLHASDPAHPSIVIDD